MKDNERTTRKLFKFGLGICFQVSDCYYMPRYELGDGRWDSGEKVEGRKFKLYNALYGFERAARRKDGKHKIEAFIIRGYPHKPPWLKQGFFSCRQIGLFLLSNCPVAITCIFKTVLGYMSRTFAS